MAGVAEKTDPALWKQVKKKVTKSAKGGKPGQWSARKAQLATQEYKHEGGGYKGKKSADNHLQQWQDEDWGTKSGKDSLETGERYLPKEARDHLSKEEYRRTSDKKRSDLRNGKQFSSQPADIADKTAHYRDTGSSGKEPTKAELMNKARAKDVRGRSKMTKAQLAEAVA